MRIASQTDFRIRPANIRDVDEAAPAIHELLALLPELQVVVLLGKWAARGWKRLGIETLRVIEAPHPSPLSLNTTPGACDRLRDALVAAREMAS